MIRDVRLRPLSRDHYHALVLARFIGAICARGGMDAQAADVVKERFAVEIAPHFLVEETLLTALEGHGVDHLVERTRKEHALLLKLLDDALTGQATCMCELGELLIAHVRFEERELYPACEQLLSPEALDRIASAHHQQPHRES